MSALFRFYAVGAGGVLVQLAALTLFKSGLHFGYLPATTLAVERATCTIFSGTSAGRGHIVRDRFPRAGPGG